MEIYGQIKQNIGVILRKLCQQKGVEIIETRACPDHIHMLISIPPKYSVSQIMGYLVSNSNILLKLDILSPRPPGGEIESGKEECLVSMGY